MADDPSPDGLPLPEQVALLVKLLQKCPAASAELRRHFEASMPLKTKDRVFSAFAISIALSVFDAAAVVPSSTPHGIPILCDEDDDTFINAINGRDRMQ